MTAIPLGRRLPDASSNLPGRPDPDIDPEACASRRPYSVLLPVGFAVPPALPPARCALTAPFHPCRDSTQHAAAVCSLWRCPWVCTRRMLSGTACPRSPDFPPRQPFGFAEAAVRPTDGTGMGRPSAVVKGQPRASPYGRGQRWCGYGRGSQAGRATCRALTGRRRRQRVPGGNGAGKRPRLRRWRNRTRR